MTSVEDPEETVKKKEKVVSLPGNLAAFLVRNYGR